MMGGSGGAVGGAHVHATECSFCCGALCGAHPPDTRAPLSHASDYALLHLALFAWQVAAMSEDEWSLEDIAMALKKLYGIASRGAKSFQLSNELSRLEGKYNSLPDKRRRPGPAIRKAISEGKQALASNNIDLFMSIVKEIDF